MVKLFEKFWGWGLLVVVSIIIAATLLVFLLPEKYGTRMDSWALVIAAIMMGWAAWQNRSAAFGIKEQVEEMRKQQKTLDSIRREQVRKSSPKLHPKRYNNI